MTSAPTRLFHITRPAVVASILEHGLLGTPAVFMSESVEDCLRFMGARLGTFFDFDNLTELRIDPPPPDLVEQVRAGHQFGRIELAPDPDHLHDSSCGLASTDNNSDALDTIDAATSTPRPECGTREVLYVGVPTREENHELAAIEVDATVLEPHLLRVSDDHSAFVFGDVTSWMYLADVPASAVVGVDFVPV